MASTAAQWQIPHTTVDQEGRVNVAPKSWISHVCREPDLLVIGCNRHHHTAANLLAKGECVLNFPSDQFARQTWKAGWNR